MKLISKASFKNDLNFKPLRPWPEELPPMAWGEYLVAGWNSRSDLALQCEGRLENLLASCHPKLELSELARLHQNIQTAALAEFDSAGFFQNYGYRASHRFFKTLKLILKLPVEAQLWCDEKKLRPSDVEIFNSFESLEVFFPVFARFKNLQVSKSQGVEILELVGELSLFESQTAPVAEFKSADEWLTDLRRRRFPLREAAAQSAGDKINSLPWPQKTLGRWCKSGDHDVLEVTFQIENPIEYSKKLDQLQKLKENIEEARLWTSKPS